MDKTDFKTNYLKLLNFIFNNVLLQICYFIFQGQSDKGCQSIVLAGGYEDDTDNGDEFVYTGSGGRDLSGNKRTAKQSADQVGSF